MSFFFPSSNLDIMGAAILGHKSSSIFLFWCVFIQGKLCKQQECMAYRHQLFLQIALVKNVKLVNIL